VVDGVGSSQFLDSPSEHRWVASVQLQRTKCFVDTKLHHRVGLFVAVHQTRGHDHFVDVHEPWPKLAAQAAKWRIGYSSHWRQHHGWPHAVLAQLQRFQ
jgi:hypothetical protein